MSDQLLANKGKLGGSCNRSACLAPNARWYNRYTEAHYCEKCANLLNQVLNERKMEILEYISLETMDQ